MYGFSRLIIGVSIFRIELDRSRPSAPRSQRDQSDCSFHKVVSPCVYSSRLIGIFVQNLPFWREAIFEVTFKVTLDFSFVIQRMEESRCFSRYFRKILVSVYSQVGWVPVWMKNKNIWIKILANLFLWIRWLKTLLPLCNFSTVALFWDLR